MTFAFIGGPYDGHTLDESSNGPLAGHAYQKMLELTDSGTLGTTVHLLARPDGPGTRRSAAYTVVERSGERVILKVAQE